MLKQASQQFYLWEDISAGAQLAVEGLDGGVPIQVIQKSGAAQVYVSRLGWGWSKLISHMD